MPTWNLHVIISELFYDSLSLPSHAGEIRSAAKPNLLSIRCQKNKNFEIMPKVDLATPTPLSAAACSPISLLNTTFFFLWPFFEWACGAASDCLAAFELSLEQGLESRIEI
jgi:hypothetical protein